MMPQEQVFFTDHSVYISNTRLVLRKGGTYPIANLAQVTLGRMAASRFWIGPLIFGCIFLALGSSVLLNGELYLVIGGSLLLIGIAGVLFQLVCPLYVVVLKGTFGTARPFRRRNRRYLMKVVAALNEAVSKRGDPPMVVQSTHIGQVISGISIGQGAQANIGTSGNARNVHQESDARRPMSGLHAFNQSGLNPSHQEGQVDLRAGAWNSRDRRADQPVPASTEARHIIISYSHEDRQWLDLLRTHLVPLERQGMIALWDDTQIAAGMQTRQAMTDALEAADFALLLVSADFLASEVIMRYELPQIFQRLARGRFTLLPLILSPCLYGESPLAGYQPFNPTDPLSRLTPPKRDDVLVRVAKEIQQVVV